MMNLTHGQARPVLTKTNLFREGYFSLVQHRTRAIATIAAASIGIFGLVAGIGITRTRDAQTLNRFDALAATHLTAKPRQTGLASYLVQIPADAEERLEAINGIVSAGIYASLRTRSSLDALTPLVRSTPRESDAGKQTVAALLRAASPSFFPAIGTRFASGRPFSENHNTYRDRVCVVGLGVANRLGIASLVPRPSVFIGDDHFEVIGILDNAPSKPELLEAVILPLRTAEELFVIADKSVEIRTSVNATNLPPGFLNSHIQLTLAHSFPGAISVTQPAGLTNTVRDKNNADLNTGLALLAGLLTTLTIATIAISTSSALQTRTHEIGLRRALGAARKHIRRQIMLEASATGAVAAILGTLAGLLTTLAWAEHNHWKVVLDRYTIPGALIAGPLVGIIGSLWPAWKASRQQPADTLRSS
jgi:putative ABC transport system permease protein